MSFTLDKANRIATQPSWGISGKDNSIPEVNSSIKPIDRDLSIEELEKQELVLDPKGQIFRVLGSSHSKGGTPVRLEEGSFVFSNHKPLAIKKEDKELFKFKTGGTVKQSTPAKVLQKEVDIKHHNQMIAISSSDKHDAISKKSAELMLQKNFKKVGEVAYLQEEYKGFPQGLPSFAEKPISDPNIEVMEQQYKEGGFKPLYQRGGRKNGQLFGQDWTKYTSENPQDFKLSVEALNNGLPIEYPHPQHFVGNGMFNEMQNLQDFKRRQDWYIQNNPNWNPKNKGDVKNFQNAYNQEAQKRGYSPYFEGNSTMAIDDKFGRYTYNAPGFMNNKPVDLSTVNPNREYSPVPTPSGNPLSPSFPTYVPPEAPVQDPILPYNPNIPLSPLQKLSLAQSGYQAASINKYQPKRQQVNFTPVNLERVNDQPYLNQINNQTQQAYRTNQVMSPIQARASNSQIYGQSLDKASQTLGQIDNQNRQISNQENLYNNQGINNSSNQNVQLDGKYFAQVTQLNENYDQENRFARNRLFDEYKGYRTQNDALELNLQSQPTFGTRQVYQNPQTGEISQTPKQGWTKRRQAAPLYDYNNQTNQVYFTGAGMSLDQVPAGSTAGLSFTQLKSYADDLGLDARGRAYIFRDWAKQSNPYSKK